MGKAAPLNDLAPTVRDLIAASGKKQVEIAELSGVPQTTISGVLNGRIKTQPPAALAALARALGVDARALLDAQARPRRVGEPPGMPEDVRHAFRDVRFVPPEEQDAYWQEVLADVLHINRKYVERQRGPSHYPRR